MLTLFLLITGLALFSSIYSSAQAHSEKPDENKLNILFLEHLIKTQVDSVRKAHGLQPLVSDSILYVAAQDHASYLSTEKTISHYQKEKIKHAPQIEQTSTALRTTLSERTCFRTPWKTAI
jgi:uncharacterized protein YkwD